MLLPARPRHSRPVFLPLNVVGEATSRQPVERLGPRPAERLEDIQTRSAQKMYGSQGTAVDQSSLPASSSSCRRCHTLVSQLIPLIEADLAVRGISGQRAATPRSPAVWALVRRGVVPMATPGTHGQ